MWHLFPRSVSNEMFIPGSQEALVHSPGSFRRLCGLSFPVCKTDMIFLVHTSTCGGLNEKGPYRLIDRTLGPQLVGQF